MVMNILETQSISYFPKCYSDYSLRSCRSQWCPLSPSIHRLRPLIYSKPARLPNHLHPKVRLKHLPRLTSSPFRERPTALSQFLARPSPSNSQHAAKPLLLMPMAMSLLAPAEPFGITTRASVPLLSSRYYSLFLSWCTCGRLSSTARSVSTLLDSVNAVLCSPNESMVQHLYFSSAKHF